MCGPTGSSPQQQRHQLWLLAVAALLLAQAPSANAAGCYSTPYQVCVAATQPSYTTDVWASCNNLVSIFYWNSVPWPSEWFCTTRMPVSYINTGDPLYFVCGNTYDLATFQRIVQTIWALTSPYMNYNFQGQFMNLYLTASNRNNAAASMWSYFGCNTFRFPPGATDGIWQLQFYQAGFVSSPPPPQSYTSSAIVLSGSSTSGTYYRRRSLSAVFDGAEGMMSSSSSSSSSSFTDTSSEEFFRSSTGATMEAMLGPLGAKEPNTDSIAATSTSSTTDAAAPASRKLQQYMPSPVLPGSTPLFAINVTAIEASIGYGNAPGLATATLQAIGVAGLRTSLRGIITYVPPGLGSATIQLQYATAAAAEAFFAYVTTQPGLDTFVITARDAGGLPCGTTLVVSQGSFDNSSLTFVCTPDNTSPIITAGLRSLCCAPPPFPPLPPFPPTLPPSPPPPSPRPPSPPLGSEFLDTVTSRQLAFLNIPVTNQLPDDPLPPLSQAPFTMIVAPYLNPSFVSSYLNPAGTNMAPRYTEFIDAGGILLVLATYQTVLPASQVCTAPMALLAAVLGPSRLSGCACGAIGHNDVIGKYDLAAGIAVLGEQGGVAVATVNGQDYPISVPLVGGVPITCSAEPNGESDFDLMPLFYYRFPMPSILSGYRPTDPGRFIKVPGSESIPTGYRVINCNEANANSAAVLALVSYLDVCGINGGTVRGGRTGFDGLPGYLIQCPDAIPPPGFGCRIAMRTTTLRPPSPRPPSPRPPPPFVKRALLHKTPGIYNRFPPPPPPPPPPPATNPILRLGPGEQTPPNYREFGCLEAAQYEAFILELVADGERCAVYAGRVEVVNGGTNVTCTPGANPPMNCRLVVNRGEVRAVGSSLVRAWRVGGGWVVYAGANINIPVTPISQADAEFWNALITEIDQIPRGVTAFPTPLPLPTLKK